MVGIVRNAEIKFANKKEFQDFEKNIAKKVPHVTLENLKKEVESDGIVIHRGEEVHESK